jgi:hypothetical protein
MLTLLFVLGGALGITLLARTISKRASHGRSSESVTRDGGSSSSPLTPYGDSSDCGGSDAGGDGCDGGGGDGD